MSKKINLTDQVMSRIEKEGINMKPAWYFILSSAALSIGLAALAVVSVFTVNLAVFSLRSHGPLGQVRAEQLLSSFPWWTLPLALLGLGLGLWFLRRYDFSYRHNFLVLALGFILAVILAGFALDYLGVDRLWSGRGPLRGIYRQYSGPSGRGSHGFGPPAGTPGYRSD